LEDPHRILSDEELLKLCQSMRLCALSEDECAVFKVNVFLV
jgi:hypothetical protein